MSSNVVIPNSKISSSQSGPLSIEDLQVGPISIGKISLSNFTGKFQYKSATMKNLQMRFHITPYIDWRIGIYISMPWPFDDIYIGDSGHYNFDAIDTNWIHLNDVPISSGNLDLSIKDTSFGPFTIGTTAIKGEVNVESINVDDIKMAQTKVPTGLPSLMGADIEVPNPVGATNISVLETDMAKFSSRGIIVPNLTFSSIQALNVNIAEAQSGQINVTTKEFNYTAGTANLLGIASITLGFKIWTEMSAANILFDGLSGDVATDSASSSGFTMNVDMNGLVLCRLKLNGFSVPSIKYEG